MDPKKAAVPGREQTQAAFSGGEAVRVSRVLFLKINDGTSWNPALNGLRLRKRRRVRRGGWWWRRWAPEERKRHQQVGIS